MEDVQQWCDECGELRLFAPVPDTDRAEYACVECGAAVSVAAVPAGLHYAAVA